MKRVIGQILILVTVCALPLGAAARTALDFFTDPAAAVRFVDTNTRLDMADYFRSGMAYSSASQLDEPVRIISADSLKVTYRNASLTEATLSVMATGKDTVLVMTQTYRLPLPESRVLMFGKDWKPVRHSSFRDHELNDWLTAQGRAERGEVEAWLPFITATASFDPAARRITWTNTMDQYFAGKEEADRLKRWIKPEISFTFDGKRFRLDK